MAAGFYPSHRYAWNTIKARYPFPAADVKLGESTARGDRPARSREEIGLEPEDVRLLGRMNDAITITHYRVTPVVGVIPWPYPLRLEPAEVGRVFTIPLLWLADRPNWDEQPVRPDCAISSVYGHQVPPDDGEVFVGVTARITLLFIERNRNKK